MKLRSKILTVLASSLVIGGVLAGCGSQSANNNNSSSSNTPTTRSAQTKSDSSKKDAQSAPIKKPTVKSSQKKQVHRDLANHTNGAQQKTVKNDDEASKAVNNAPAIGKDGLPTVNLGNGIIGEEDRGAGQIYITFDMGNWNVIIHGNDVSEPTNTTKNDGKKLSDFVQNHTLPVPHNHGKIYVDAGTNQTKITWQEGHKVNTLKGKTNKVFQEIVNA